MTSTNREGERGRPGGGAWGGCPERVFFRPCDRSYIKKLMSFFHHM